MNDGMEFDGVDFDEPMEVAFEQDDQGASAEEPAKPEPTAVPVEAVKVEMKPEPQDPVLL